MAVKQTIAIIGATGTMGSALAKGLAKGPYRLLLMGSNKEKLQTLADELKDEPAEIAVIHCAKEACWEADIIIAATPYTAEKEVAEKIKEVATGKIVVSISNPLNTTFDGLLTADNSSAAEELQTYLPHAKIVKAFNTTFAADFAQPVFKGAPVDCLMAGDDEESLQTVAGLVQTVGFNPLTAGKLSKSRVLENMALLLIELNNRYHYNWKAGWKVVH